MTNHLIKVSLPQQKLFYYQDKQLVKEFIISSAKNGIGELNGSEKTPRGWHIIRAKIGDGADPNAVFIQRRQTGEIYTSQLKKDFPNRDWILGRILWLSGSEIGKNRLGNVDTMRRYIYIHGTPDEIPMGIPGSRGCIRMRNAELIELFNKVPLYTQVYISED